MMHHQQLRLVVDELSLDLRNSLLAPLHEEKRLGEIDAEEDEEYVEEDEYDDIGGLSVDEHVRYTEEPYTVINNYYDYYDPYYDDYRWWQSRYYAYYDPFWYPHWGVGFGMYWGYYPHYYFGVGYGYYNPWYWYDGYYGYYNYGWNYYHGYHHGYHDGY